MIASLLGGVALALAAAAPPLAPSKNPLFIEPDGSAATHVDVAAGESGGALWLPLQAPLGQRRLDVVVVVNGAPVVARLDTGAARTSMSSALAARLGVKPKPGALLGVDATGKTTAVRRAQVATLLLGTRTLTDVDVEVLDAEREVFVLGLDQLMGHELVLALERGLVGLLPLGATPRNRDDQVIPLARAADGRLHARVAAGTAVAELVVDTGAEATSFPAAPALLAALPADLRFKSTVVGMVGTERHEGFFRIDHLLVGGVDVGAVFAREARNNQGNGPGRLGVDVLGRTPSVLVLGEEPEWRRLPVPAFSNRAVPTPGRYPFPCMKHCVTAELRELDADARGRLNNGRALFLPRVRRPDDVCLWVDIDAAFAGSVVEFVVGDVDGDAGRLSGHVLTVQTRVPVGGSTQCLELPLSTAALAWFPRVPVALRHVRSGRAVTAACEADTCMWWSGP